MPSIAMATRCSGSGYRCPMFRKPEARDFDPGQPTHHLFLAKRAAFEVPVAEPRQLPCVLSPVEELMEANMGRGILLWLLGVPIPVIILLWLFFGR
jgi:hypothetical protein